MAKFLRTSGISYKIEDIIISAKEELVIVSPYLKISNNLFERLKEKSEQGVRIDFVYGKSELSFGEKRKIESLKTINLYYYENLHAKCYYNEQEMIITSMNLYEFSEKNNREMGMLLTKAEDVENYTDGVQETKSILNASKKIIAVQNGKAVPTSDKSLLGIRRDVPLNLSTINILLLEDLKDRFPNQAFAIIDSGRRIYCENFLIADIALEIQPISTSSIYISIKLMHLDRTINRDVFDLLRKTYVNDIESKFPANIVQWDLGMKRMRLSVSKNKFAEMYETNQSAINGIIEFIEMLEAEVVSRIGSCYEDKQVILHVKE